MKVLSSLLLIGVFSDIWAQNLLDPIPRACRSLGGDANDKAVAEGGQRNEYPAGGTLMALAEVPAGLKGVFEFYLCPEDGNNEQEECLIRIPLKLAGGPSGKFDLSTVEKPGVYEIPIIIPDGISCSACTLQWRVLVEKCPGEQCQLVDEEFCADISVRELKTANKRIFSLIFGAIKHLFSSG